MGESFGKFLSGPIGSALRVFLGAVLGYLVLDLQTDGKVSVSLDDVNTWIAAGLVVAVPLIIAALNRQDPRFGNVEKHPVTPPTAD